MKKAKRTAASAKALAVLCACGLTISCVTSTTLAWLVATTDPVVNTFTYGDINIALDETDTGLDGDGDPHTNDYKMIPSTELTKDPRVTVKQGSEDCWLFVELTEAGGVDPYTFDDFLTYTVNSDWVQLTNADETPVDGVYYRAISADEVKDADQVFSVIQDDKVTVKDTVTKEMLNALNPEGADPTYPTLTVTAYAVQRANVETAQDAWAIAKPTE